MELEADPHAPYIVAHDWDAMDVRVFHYNGQPQGPRIGSGFRSPPARMAIAPLSGRLVLGNSERGTIKL
jgi:hypothetical protein